MPRTVIFDMDGVIVDSEVHWKNVESQFLFGVIPGWSDEDQQGILGMSAYDVHAKLVHEYGATFTVDEYFEFYHDLSHEIYGKRSSMIPGVEPLIRGLYESGTPLGLCSSSPHEWIDIVLDRFDLRCCFTTVLSGSDVKGRGKPAPDIYLAALAKLGASAADTAAIEDTEKGVRSAKGAGLYCFGFRNGFNADQDLSAADRVLEDFRITPAKLLEFRAATSP